ncbi:Uncharacterised protein [Chryseobacterium nakagawai]|nr:Uncharacterised protein [Chryseobacterium nakagawai]
MDLGYQRNFEFFVVLGSTDKFCHFKFKNLEDEILQEK